jgi:hypothetical protein
MNYYTLPVYNVTCYPIRLIVAYSVIFGALAYIIPISLGEVDPEVFTTSINCIVNGFDLYLLYSL